MNSQIEYTCPCCGKPGTAEYDPEYVREIGKWKPMLHCDRCADFRSELSRLRESAKRVCMIILTTGEISKSRDKLTEITKKISNVVCNQWRVTNVWEPDFVNQLVDQPRQSDTIINLFARGIRKMRKAAG